MIDIPYREFSSNSCHSSGAEIVERANEVFASCREYRYEATSAIQFKKDVVWNALVHSETWHVWMGHGRADDKLGSLPIEFGSGHKLVPSEKEHGDSACVIEGENRSALTVRWSNRNADTLYYSVRLSPYSRTETKVSLVTRYFHKQEEGGVIARFLGISKAPSEEPDGHRQGFLRRSEKALKKFEGVCYDLSHFGGSIDAGFDELYWKEWNYHGGTLFIHPDENGDRNLRPGMSFSGDERIGYVFDPDFHESEEYAKENCFVHGYKDFTLRNVIKKHGDTVATNDRIFLMDYGQEQSD